MVGPASIIRQKKVFRLAELLAEKSLEPSLKDKHNVRILLHRYCKQGKIKRVRRGLYVASSEARVHPFLIARSAVDDAVLAYHSALESYGLAYTDFNEHTYITSHRTQPFLWEGQYYRPVHQSAQARVKTGIETFSYMGLTVRRTTLARTVVDVLDCVDISGGFEEVIRSLDRLETLDVQAAVKYALSLKRASIVAKLGYYLEYQAPECIDIDSPSLSLLQSHIPNQPYSIDRRAKKQNVLCKKWQIMVPRFLHDRAWEEPNVYFDQGQSRSA